MAHSKRQRILRERIAERDGPECCWCGKELTVDEMTLEHVIRKADGGTDDPENLRIACAPCNNDRHYKTKPGNRKRNRPNPRQRKAARRKRMAGQQPDVPESPLSTVWVYSSQSDNWQEGGWNW